MQPDSPRVPEGSTTLGSIIVRLASIIESRCIALPYLIERFLEHVVGMRERPSPFMHTWIIYRLANGRLQLTLSQQGMCKNLVEKGDLSQPLIVFNRTTKRAEDLSSKLGQGKSTVAKTLDEAVSKADIIFMCLGDDAAVTDSFSVAAKNDIKGKLFVDCSTVHPNTTDMLSKTMEAQGAEFVACPGMPGDSV